MSWGGGKGKVQPTISKPDWGKGWSKGWSDDGWSKGASDDSWSTLSWLMSSKGMSKGKLMAMAYGKGKGKGKDKGKDSSGKGKGKGAGPVTAVTPQTAPPGAGYNQYYQQQMAMYGARYPGYGGYGFGYGYNPYAYQAAAYQYAAAAAAAAATPQGGYGAGQAARSSPGFNVPALAGQKTYEGLIKSLSSKNGYGFISCDETFSQFRRDVYVGQRDMPDGVQVGDRVRFEVTLNNKEHPRADKVTVIGRS